MLSQGPDLALALATNAWGTGDKVVLTFTNVTAGLHIVGNLSRISGSSSAEAAGHNHTTLYGAPTNPHTPIAILVLLCI